MNVFFSKKKSFDFPVMFYKRQRGYLGTICPEYQVHPRSLGSWTKNAKLKAAQRHPIGRLNNLGKPNPLKARPFQDQKMMEIP